MNKYAAINAVRKAVLQAVAKGTIVTGSNPLQVFEISGSGEYSGGGDTIYVSVKDYEGNEARMSIDFKARE